MDDFREWLSDNLRYIMLGLFILLVLGVLFLGIKFISAKVSDQDSEQTKQEIQEEQPVENEETTAEEPAEKPEVTPEEVSPQVQELEKEVYPDVNAVIQTYYTALGGKDIAEIKSVVDNLDATEEAKITKDPYIESYSNVETYTVNGPEEGTYIVYAAYTYKFKDIDTQVPGLSQLYVCSDETGRLYISTKEQDAQTQEYIAGTMELADVKSLIADVQKKYTTALERDEKLKAFIEGLGIGSSEAASAEDGSMITVKSDCNVRKEPNEDAEVLGKLQEGMQVTKTGTHGTWIAISYEGATGYVRSDLFQ